MTAKKSLQFYLRRNYPFVARVLDDGEYYVEFPDLPGLMTGAATLEDLPGMMREALGLHLEATHEQGDVPEPTVLDIDELDYSGKFNLRLPRALHRTLADTAEHEGVSLNQYVVSLLSRNDAQARVEARLDAIEARVGASTLPATKIADARVTYGTNRARPARRRQTSVTSGTSKRATKRSRS
jgi:predicted RNase H-like HicB family nuclease